MLYKESTINCGGLVGLNSGKAAQTYLNLYLIYSVYEWSIYLFYLLKYTL